MIPKAINKQSLTLISIVFESLQRTKWKTQGKMKPRVALPMEPTIALTYAKSSFSAIAMPAVVKTIKVRSRFFFHFLACKQERNRKIKLCTHGTLNASWDNL